VLGQFGLLLKHKVALHYVMTMAAKEDPTTDGSSGQEWTANDSQVDPSSSQNESPRVSGKLAILFCAISIGIFCGGLVSVQRENTARREHLERRRTNNGRRMPI
jgi:hypothetical protein